MPEQTLGRVATCKCGKKFRLGKKPAMAAAATSAQAKSAPAPRPKPTPPKVSEPAKVSDSFWDDALNEPLPAGNTGASMLGPTAPTPSPAPNVSTAPPKKKKKKRKQSAGFSWGADWAKVGGGLATFVIAGGITVVLVITTGYLFYWPAIIAVIGLFSALAGLIGR